MKENDQYFSEDYTPESITDKKLKDRKALDILPKKSEPKKPYISGKPYRTIIRARITHD